MYPVTSYLGHVQNANEEKLKTWIMRKKGKTRMRYLIVPFIFFLGCNAQHDTAQELIVCEFHGGMMGTDVSIKVKCDASRQPNAYTAMEHAVATMEKSISTISSWVPESQTSLVNRQAGIAPVKIGPELMSILQKSQEIADMSHGAFDITFSAVGKLYELRPVLPVIPTDEQIDQALPLVDYKKLKLNHSENTAYLQEKGMRIDLGGIAKGTIVDAAAATLRREGFDYFLINAGGDLLASTPDGCDPWRISINNPRDARGKPLGTVAVTNEAIVTSGDYEKMVEIDGKRYHHIIDPRTGRPVEGCISVTVIGPDAESADALATAFFVMGPNDGLALCEQIQDVEAFFITPDFESIASSHFPVINPIRTLTSKE